MRLLRLLVNSDRGSRKRPHSMHLLNDGRHQTAACTSNLLGICSLPQYRASHLDSWLRSLILLPTCSALIPLTFSYPALSHLRVTACSWLAYLTSSSTACWPLPRCLESLAACLSPKQFAQPWTDVFFNYYGSLITTPERFATLPSAWSTPEAPSSYPGGAGFGSSRQILWTPLEVSTTA